MDQSCCQPQVAVILIFIVSGLCLDSISECLQYKVRSKLHWLEKGAAIVPNSCGTHQVQCFQALTLSIVLVLGVTPLLAWPILHFGHLVCHVPKFAQEGS